jgi:hypothetical protein
MSRDAVPLPVTDMVSRTDFEVEGPNETVALEEFLRDRAGSLERVGYLDAHDRRHPVGFHVDPERMYTWVDSEGGYMRYLGMEEIVSARVRCPLCKGHGQVDEDVADEFDEVWGEDEAEEA